MRLFIWSLLAACLATAMVASGQDSATAPVVVPPFGFPTFPILPLADQPPTLAPVPETVFVSAPPGDGDSFGFDLVVAPSATDPTPLTGYVNATFTYSSGVWAGSCQARVDEANAAGGATPMPIVASYVDAGSSSTVFCARP